VVNAASFILGTSFLAGPTFVPLFLVNVRGASATEAGLAMLPLTFGIVLGSAAGGQLAARVTHMRGLVLGALMALGLAFAAMALVLSPTTPVRVISALLFVIGLAMGPTLPLLTIGVQNAVPFRKIGPATAAVTFARGLGQVTGLGLLGSVFSARVGAALAPPAEGAAASVALDAAGQLAVTSGLSRLYAISAAITLLGIVAVLQLPAEMSARRAAPRGGPPSPTPEPLVDAAA
jgi:MFS family permease